MINKILQEFLNANIKIKSKEILIQYIEFCIKWDIGERKIDKDGYSESSLHHILPNSLFPQFNNLKKDCWNGSHLSFFNHYKAHWLLTEAIDDHGQLHAFCCMHTLDVANGRLNEEDLIGEQEFDLKMKERNKNIGINYKKALENDPSIQERISRNHSKTKSSKEWKDTVGKDSAKKQSETKSSKEWKDTVGKEKIRKFKISYQKSFDKKKFDETILKRSKFKNFEIYNEFDELMHKYEGLLTEFCVKHNLPYSMLCKSNKDNKLYTTAAGLRSAKKAGYEIYKGYYLVLL